VPVSGDVNWPATTTGATATGEDGGIIAKKGAGTCFSRSGFVTKA